MKILLVEDEAFNLVVLKEMIRIYYSDVEIMTANNGEEAFKILKDHSFTLILSDINMPKMDGYALIKNIKEELNLTTPTVAVTAFAIQGDKEKILLSGFDNYISKPIDMPKLKEILNQYLD